MARNQVVSEKTYNEQIVDDYVDSILSGKKAACKETKQACKRYLKDKENKEFDFRLCEAEDAIFLIENTIVLLGGEDKDGLPFMERPFLLQPWQKFVVFNLFGFYSAGSKIRRFTEALIFIPKKNGKTPFAGALAWAFAYKYAGSGSKVLLTSHTLKQSMFSFNFIRQNLELMGELPKKKGKKVTMQTGQAYRFSIIDNNNEHVLKGDLGHGTIEIEAFSGDLTDGLNGNFVIADEIHQYRNSEQYTYYQKAMKAYRNKLILAITTAGEDTNSFCFHRVETCKKILNGTHHDNSYFVFITKADQASDGKVDYLSALEHEKANPGYGVTVMPQEIMREARLASIDSKTLPGFLAKELNIFMPSMKAYFKLETLRNTDGKYYYTLEELAKLPIVWYGGVDLSKVKDLTAAVLYGNFEGIDIIIPHAWFPITAAYEKAKKDNIDLFGWQQDGFLDMCNANTIQQQDIVNWFIKMRNMGFKIKEIRYDRTFGDEFVEVMKANKFNVVDQPQLYKKTTKGFQRIDRMCEEGRLYYCHSEAFEYCATNVAVTEKTGGYIEFSKIGEKHRIDIFAAAVFACVGMIECNSKLMNERRQLGVGKVD